jgi:alkanesulfonate monooxygenase SsuD/methylene tetrahydromethanopterin reductase-like flavin-dependent oxidoreductase (luciferase family)
MDFGIFESVGRPTRTPADAWEEDLFEIVTGDRLGFSECWISEHLFPAELLISQCARETSQIKLGPGVRPVPIYHPLQLATEANACDHLTHGRYMFGAGTGFMSGRFNVMRQRGMDDGTAHARLWETIDFLRRIWTATEPFDYQGKFYEGRGVWQGIVPRLPPFQQPHPPIAVACHESPETAVRAGEEGIWMLLGHAADNGLLQDLSDAYLSGLERARRPVTRKEIRIARFVYVCDSVAQAKAELRDSMSDAIAREVKNTPHHFARNLPPSGRVEDVDFDWVIDSGQFIVGDPDTVCRRVLDLFQVTGGFGMLMFYMGRDYGTREGRARSLELFMEQVAPRLRDLDPDSLVARAPVAAGVAD